MFGFSVPSRGEPPATAATGRAPCGATRPRRAPLGVARGDRLTTVDIPVVEARFDRGDPNPIPDKPPSAQRHRKNTSGITTKPPGTGRSRRAGRGSRRRASHGPVAGACGSFDRPRAPRAPGRLPQGGEARAPGPSRCRRSRWRKAREEGRDAKAGLVARRVGEVPDRLFRARELGRPRDRASGARSLARARRAPDRRPGVRSVRRAELRSIDGREEDGAATRRVSRVAGCANVARRKTRRRERRASARHGRGSSAGEAVRTGTHRETRETRRVRRHETRRRTLPRAAGGDARRRRRRVAGDDSRVRAHASLGGGPAHAVGGCRGGRRARRDRAHRHRRRGRRRRRRLRRGAGESRARGVRGGPRVVARRFPRAHSARGGAGRGRACVRHRRAVVRARGAGEGRHRRVRAPPLVGARVARLGAARRGGRLPGLKGRPRADPVRRGAA